MTRIQSLAVAVASVVSLVAASQACVAQSATSPGQNRDLAIEVTPAPKPSKRPQQGRVPVQVSLMSIGASTINIGQPVRFQVSSNKASFGHVYIANASGQVYLLGENIRLRARAPLVVPKPSLTLRASAPAGDNTVVFVATRERLPGFAGGATTTTPRDIQVSGAELLGRLDQQLSAFDRDDWGMTKMSVRVLP